MYRKKVSHHGKNVKMCQFYSDSFRFFLQPTACAIPKVSEQEKWEFSAVFAT
jgi:hypothetical protein